MRKLAALPAAFFVLLALPAPADTLVQTGAPDGLMAAASQPGDGEIEIEAADDFVVACDASITGGSFTGVVVGSGSFISDIVVEIYRVFPQDSTDPPSGNVPTRANSPSDVVFASRVASALELTWSVTELAASFTAANSVLNGIHPKPNQTTGGDGPVTGAEYRFDFSLATPISLPAGHYFFVPQIVLDSGQFYWLSSPHPIVSGTPFSPDLQMWIRNANLAPDWLRVGTDIVGGTTPPTFNGAFSLSGTSTPLGLQASPPSPLVVPPGAPIPPVTFVASGGTPPYTFSESGTLPGLSFDTSTGVLSGTPNAVGDFPITVSVSDVNGCTSAEVSFVIRVQIRSGIPTLGAAGLAALLVALAGAGVFTLRR